MKTMLSIALNLEAADCPKWKGCTELILLKCKALLDSQEEEKLISIMFTLMDALDPNYNHCTTAQFKQNELTQLLEFGV